MLSKTLVASDADECRARGNQYYMKRQYNLAVTEYSKGISIDETDKFLYSNRSIAFMKMDKNTDAYIDAFSTLIFCWIVYFD